MRVVAVLWCFFIVGNTDAPGQSLAPSPTAGDTEFKDSFSTDLRDQIMAPRLTSSLADGQGSGRRGTDESADRLSFPFKDDDHLSLDKEEPDFSRTFGMSLGDYERSAVANHPAIEKISAQVREAKWRCQQAGLFPDMYIGYNGSEMGTEGTSGLQGGFLSQRFVTGKKNRLNQCVISQEIEQLEQKLAEMRQRILTDVRNELVTAYTEQERIKVLRRSLQLNQRAERSAKELIDNNEIPRRAYLDVRSIVDLSELKLNASRQEHLASWRRLSSLCGFDETSTNSASLGLLPDSVLPGKESPSWEETLASVVATSPEISAAMARIDQHRCEIARARAERYPDINAQVTFQHDDVSSDDVTSVSASIPIPRKRRVQAEIGQATARLRQAEQQLDLISRSIRHRLASEFEQLQSACQQAKIYEKRILPRLVESRNLTLQALDNGEVNYLEWVTSERAFLVAMEEYLNALKKCWTGKYRIQGLLLSDSFELRR